MKLSRLTSTPWGLRRVTRALRRISERRDDRLDMTTAREEMRRLIDEMVAGSFDEEIYEAVDRYVYWYVSDFLREMHERHLTELQQLDLLEIKVRPYLDEAGALNNHEQTRLAHLDGAVTSALDHLSDPEEPHYDPIPRQGRRDGHRP